MIFINPWASYKSEDIPDINPHNDEEAIGCIGGIVAFCISSLIFIMLMYAANTLVNKNIINTKIMMIFVVANFATFVTLTIILMKLSFKLADKFITKKRKNI